jgi:hypothetical protein
VRLDRVLGDVKGAGDLAVSEAVGDELQHLALARREPRDDGLMAQSRVRLPHLRQRPGRGPSCGEANLERGMKKPNLRHFGVWFRPHCASRRSARPSGIWVIYLPREHEVSVGIFYAERRKTPAHSSREKEEKA